jgi:hypothetical protein
MRRSRIGLAVAGVLTLALSGSATAAPRDSAVGTGESEVGRVSFAAHGGPLPFEPVTGHFTAKGSLGGVPGTEFHFEGPVTCLMVEENRAGLFYPIKNAKPPIFEGQGVFIFLKDNGNPASGDPPDEIGFLGPMAAPPNPGVCPLGATPFELQQGNITIRDAP